MKMVFGSAVVLLTLYAPGGLAPAPRVPVLVELFTSEGCSSCPPADGLLESLQRDQPVDGVEIIPIGLHIDYFDHLGWKDTFGSPTFTARQRDYSPIFGPDSLYTPQIVVDGTEAVTGNDGDLVRRAIGSAAQRPHLPLHATAQLTGDRLRLTIDLPAAPANAEKIQVLAAITQDGLSTVVKRGENNGRTLHHVAVARKLQALGFLTPDAGLVETQLQIGRSWGPNGLKAVAWLQGIKSRQVYGAAIAQIPQ
jgi:hypothetical protein